MLMCKYMCVVVVVVVVVVACQRGREAARGRQHPDSTTFATLCPSPTEASNRQWWAFELPRAQMPGEESGREKKQNKRKQRKGGPA